MNLSKWAFKSGLRGGSNSGSAPSSRRILRNAGQNGEVDRRQLPQYFTTQRDGQQELPGLQNEAHGVLRMLNQG